MPAKISPVIFDLGPISIRWYSLMYLVAFIVVYFLVRYRIAKKDLPIGISAGKKLKDLVENMLTWGLIGVLIGGRIGYMLFYNLSGFLADPLMLIRPFDQAGNFVGLAGMSFHGGVIGVVIAFVLFCRSHKIKLLAFTDLFAPAIPLGYMFGRIGNWLNGELWGRATSSSVGQYFLSAPGALPRHPSQLYEAFAEGLVLFVVLWLLRKKDWASGTISGLYLIGYSLARFIVEFFREPDAQIGFVFGPFSLGQLLSLLMAISGVVVLVVVNKRAKAQ